MPKLKCRKNQGRYMDDSGFNALRAEAVKRAVMDYAWYKKHESRLSYEQMMKFAFIKAWFHSKAFSFWCNIDPDVILRQVDENLSNGFLFHTLDETTA